ncbi:MAG: outer membrane protein assembly factor [Gammaproteobacteria bacterium]|nr:outer membrane protein assembly factor [Pseudomonadales bacterium]
MLCLLLTLSSLAMAQPPALRITNAPPALEDNIRALVQLPARSCDTEPRYLNRSLPDIRRQIIRAGRALGYYYLEEQSEFLEEEDCWGLQITVTPGDPVTVTTVDVEISSHPELFTQTLLDLPVKEGDQLNHALYERSKAELSSRAVELGFFSARFANSELRLDLQNNNASIHIDFDPGERFQFGRINLEPVDGLSEDFIRRYINFQSGSDYSTNSLVELRNILSESYYFSTVNVTPSLEQASGQSIPIQVGLELRPRRVYSTGIGATTDIGPRVRLDYEDRYLNQRGHRFDVKSSASPIQQALDANYTIPWHNPATEQLVLSGGLQREDTDTFISRTGKLGASYSFINRWLWRQTYFVNYQHDRSTINDTDEVTDLLIPGVSLSRTRADDALYPQKGWNLYGQLSGASDTLLSTDSFLQLHVGGKLINRLGPGRVLLRFEAGTTLTNNIHDLPVSIQYFTGGDQSVRGYKYQSLAPLDDDGEVVGGKHLLVGSAEYDFNILPNWKLAVFADAGNAFLDLNNIEMQKSVGIGVRWLSPLGPVRVDLASALDNDNKLRLHLTMGPDL